MKLANLFEIAADRDAGARSPPIPPRGLIRLSRLPSIPRFSQIARIA